MSPLLTAFNEADGLKWDDLFAHEKVKEFQKFVIFKKLLLNHRREAVGIHELLSGIVEVGFFLVQ